MDNVFEPLMARSEKAKSLFGWIVGYGSGSGMALMFEITGTLGFTISLFSYRNKHIRDLET